MTHRPRARRTAWLGAMFAAAALATMAPGAVTAASAQTASKPSPTASPTASSSPTLTLTGLDRNRGGMQISNVPWVLTSGDTGAVHADVYNGQTKMQPVLNGTERAEVDGDSVGLNNLTRGATYNISVKYTDPKTGQPMTTNTVTFTTQPSTDTQPPTTPTNLRFAPLPDPPGWYQLFWDKSTDNVDSSSDIQYVVTRNGRISNGIEQFNKGDVLTVTAIDTSNNASKPASITFNG